MAELVMFYWVVETQSSHLDDDVFWDAQEHYLAANLNFSLKDSFICQAKISYETNL